MRVGELRDSQANTENTATGRSRSHGHVSRPGLAGRQELKKLIKELTDEEMEISYRRRILHGKIDILRAELVNRLRKKHDGARRW